MAPWPDYVFEEGYGLPDLDELSGYINTNKWLSGMPSAAQAGGIDLSEMNRLLLEKVGNLTIQLLRLAEKIDERDRIFRQLIGNTNKTAK